MDIFIGLYIIIKYAEDLIILSIKIMQSFGLKWTILFFVYF